METAERKRSRRITLNLRVRPEVRCLIDRAARFAGKNRTNFVVDAARTAAERTLLDQSLIVLSPKAYIEFLARLDAPARPNERLRRSLRTRAPWK